MMVSCRDCGKPFERPVQRGRPAIRCPKCRQQNNTTPNLDKPLSIDVGIIPPPEDDTTNVVITSNSSSSAPPRNNSKYNEDFPYHYRVMVGNLGLAFAGEFEKEAIDVFNSYSKRSSMGYGQIGFEWVQLWKLNEKENAYEVFRSFTPDRSE